MRSRGSTTGPPRWVKAFGIMAILLASLFVILHLAGYGLGGHAQHGSAMDHGMHQP